MYKDDLYSNMSWDRTVEFDSHFDRIFERIEWTGTILIKCRGMKPSKAEVIRCLEKEIKKMKEEG